VHLVHEPTLAISPVEAVMLETAVGVIEAPEFQRFAFVPVEYFRKTENGNGS
jgi:hypothetical protein